MSDREAASSFVMIEESLLAIRVASKILGHLATSAARHQTVGEDEIDAIRNMLDAAHADIDAHWRAALDEHQEKYAALQAELKEAKAATAAPGSAADAERVSINWRMLMAAAAAVASYGEEAGYPLQPFLDRMAPPDLAELPAP